MEFFNAVELRRSIRAFTGEVTDEIVKRLLQAARLAPSAGNIQPWEFVVVRKSKIKKKLVEAALNQSFIEEAPVVIVVCADENSSSQGYGYRGASLYCIQDTAAATENILLAACALKLGACWVGAFNEDAVSKALKVPKGVRPIAIIPIGHPREKPLPSTKRNLEEIIHYDTF